MNKFLVTILAISSMIFWGMSFVWSAIAMEYLSPIAVVFLRLVISSLLLFIIVFITGKIEKIKKGDWKQFLLLAFFTPFLYFIGESYGIKYTSSTLSSVIISTIPLFIAIVAWYKLEEKLKITNYIGVGISFIGVMIMIQNHDYSSSSSFKGVLLLFVAVIAAIFYTIFLKKLSGKYNVLFLISVQNLIGTLYFLPIFLFYDFNTVLHTSFDLKLISAILTLAILCSTLAFIFFTISVREIGVAKTDVFTNLIPVFTAIFSYFVLKEHLSTIQIIGIILVILGLFLSQKSKKNKKMMLSDK